MTYASHDRTAHGVPAGCSDMSIGWIWSAHHAVLDLLITTRSPVGVRVTSEALSAWRANAGDEDNSKFDCRSRV